MAEDKTAEGVEEEVVEEAAEVPEKKEEEQEDAGGDAAKTGESSGEEKEEEPEEEPELDPKDVPTRKSAQGHIIERQQRTIKKLRSKEEEEDYEPEIEDDALEDDARSAIDKRVDKQNAPYIKALAGQVDEGEIQSLFASEPGAKKFEKRLRVYMQHPTYKGVAAEVIYHHLAFGQSESIGAKKKKIADVEADHLKSGGSTRRGAAKSSKLPTAEELDNMTDDEIQELQDDVLAGKFKTNKGE